MTLIWFAQPGGVLGSSPGDVVSNSSDVELIFTLACAGVVLVGLVGMLLHWRKTGSAIGILILTGGMLAIIQEPMVDTLGNMYIPPSHFTLFTTYGREMPWFAPFGYGLYFGIPAFIYILAAQRGWSRRDFQKLFAASFGLELVFELIAVNGNFYSYYGNQPFRFFELPIHWMTLNMAAAWVAAAAVYKAMPYLKGWRQLAIPLIVLCTITGSYYAQGWPIFSALHAENPPEAVLVLGSLATVALGIAIMQTMVGFLARPQGQPAQTVSGHASAAEKPGAPVAR
ncbi:hypothetical protein [Mycobacterium sp.]|uniref:hypothetical protein n=1 Tax=Mycobacterium sp. TaxID=1785 RepID=UPI003C790DA9